MSWLRSDEPRQKLSVVTTFAVFTGAFAIGALLNAEPLATTAAAQPPGWQRAAAVEATEALNGISDALFLDEPHEAIADWLDRDQPAPTTAPSGPGEIFVPTPEDPATLWVAGDSLVETIGAAVVNAAAGTGVLTSRFDVQYSSGLARPELYDWPSRVASALEADPADIVIFMVGANDGQALQVGEEFVAFGEPAWLREYSDRVDEMMQLLSARAATVYWLGLPVAADPDRSARFAAMNEIYRERAETRRDVVYVDVFGTFAGPDGEYAPLLPDATGRLVRARDPDGIHFTPEGAELVAELVLDAIRGSWQLTQ